MDTNMEKGKKCTDCNNLARLNIWFDNEDVLQRDTTRCTGCFTAHLRKMRLGRVKRNG